jgi:DNA-binding NarL/FixJ family response regulator
MEKISTLVVSRYWVIRDGLSEILKGQEDLECVGTASNIQEAIELTKHLMPNVVIIDVARHDQYPVEATKLIKSAHTPSAVLIISGDKHIDHVRACMQAGVSGYLLRDGGFEELVQTIRMLKFGKTVFGIGDVSRVLYGVSSDDTETGKRQLSELHAREVEVITLVAKGMSNKEISTDLGISESTVGSHLVNIFRKLDAKSRTEAVMYALREGWINIEDLSKQL